MKALLVDSSIDQPKMVVGEHPKPKPSVGELLVKIEATALNRADLLQKAGKYPPPEGASPILGLEMAGTVEEVGEGVTFFEAGDPVLACCLVAGMLNIVQFTRSWRCRFLSRFQLKKQPVLRKHS